LKLIILMQSEVLCQEWFCLPSRSRFGEARPVRREGGK